MFSGVNAYAADEVQQVQSEGLNLFGEQRDFLIFLSNHGFLTSDDDRLDDRTTHVIGGDATWFPTSG
jgi:hypothetical protein